MQCWWMHKYGQNWRSVHEAWGKAQTMQWCRMYKSSSKRRSVNEAWGWNNAAVKDAQIKSTMEGCAVDRGEKKFMQQKDHKFLYFCFCGRVSSCNSWMVLYHRGIVPTYLYEHHLIMMYNSIIFGERRGCEKSSFHLSIIHHSLIKTHTTH